MKKTALLLTIIMLMLSVLCACGGPGLSVATKDETPSTDDPTTVIQIPTLTSDPTPSTSEHSPTPTPTPTPSSATTPLPTTNEPQVSAVFSMLAVGDNLLHRNLLYDGKEHAGEGERFNFEHIYERVKAQISAADYAFINQESTIIGDSHLSKDLTKYYNYFFNGSFNNGSMSFISPEAALHSLKNVGFDGIGLANNHVLDGGAAGMQWAIDLIEKTEGVDRFGGYYDEADRANIPVVEHNGIKVALLGYTYATNVTTEQASKITDFRFLVPYIDDEKMVAELKAANEVADFVVVFIHWGEEIASYKQMAAGKERTFAPNEEQKRVAKLLAENGAGIIIGHHSHALQNIEYIPDGKGGQVVCAYSLGTFVSNMVDEWNHLAGLLNFDVVKWDDGRVTAENVILTPTVCWFDENHRNYTVYYLNELTPEITAASGLTRGMSIDNLYGFLYEAVRVEFLPEEYRKQWNDI